ncbi:MAG: hypothetical protein K2I42_05895 [Anaeroplasmataceae bacterium]|nr:hypothetical protein [Anaeroplasmataceae bacterium]
MLQELYLKGFLNYSKILLEYSKALGLNAEEAFVLNKILDNYLATNTLSLDDLQKQVLIKSNRLDKIVASLMERNYYEVYLSYDNGKGVECISFEPLFLRMENLLSQEKTKDPYDIEKANQFLCKNLNRVLTANELEILENLMVEEHYTYEAIVEVTEQIKSSKRVLSLKTIALALANKKTKVEANTIAPQSFQDFIKRI